MARQTCEFCHKPFTSGRSNKRFCSDRCRFRAWASDTEAASPCVYCGVPAESTDHIPPRAYRQAVRDLELSKRYPEVEVLSCRECNNLLGARPLWTVKDRKRFIKSALRRRYAKYLRIPNWSPEELTGLGTRWLRQYVETSILIRDITEKRLRW